MSHFIRRQNTFRVAHDLAIPEMSDVLPPGIYTVKFAGGFDPHFYLEETEKMKLPSKIYGDAQAKANRIFNTFEERTRSTGVLLSGEKGSGKTLLTKILSNLALSHGISTLIVNTPFCGDEFNTFMQAISQPCVVLFDEFEKVYDSEQQEAALTLLDGVVQTKKLFLLTVNDVYKINENMRNRPGRLFYSIDYAGLDQSFIKEYCEDNLKNKAYIGQVCAVTSLFYRFNFDMLQAIVEEMNRYNESVEQVLPLLNAKPSEDGRYTDYTLTLTDPKGKNISPERMTRHHVSLNPITFERIGTTIVARAIKREDPDDPDDITEYLGDKKQIHVFFDQKDIVHVDRHTGSIVLKNKDDWVGKLTKYYKPGFDFSRYTGDTDEAF